MPTPGEMFANLYAYGLDLHNEHPELTPEQRKQMIDANAARARSAADSAVSRGTLSPDEHVKAIAGLPAPYNDPGPAASAMAARNDPLDPTAR